MEKYAMYLRKSRADLEAEAHGEGETLARHKKILSELAEKKKIKINKIYEEVVSGDSIEGRPQIQALLKEIENRTYAGVFCMDIDRLARGDTIDQGIIARAFRMSGTKIITPKKEYDPNSEFDEEYFEFELFMARREFKIIGRRIQRGRIESAKEGRFIGSTAPFGYNKVKIKNDKGYTLEPNEEEAKIVQLIFELYLNGDGKIVIARKLDALGVKPRKGNIWSSATVSTILKNPTYIGKVRWGYRKYTKELKDGSVIKHREKNDKCVYVDGLHTPIISESDFNKAQQILKARYCPPKRLDTDLKNPMSGLIYCGKCGAKMTRLGENKRSKFATIKCSNKYCNTVSAKIDLVENSVINFLENWIKEYKISVKRNSPTPSMSAVELHRNRLENLNSELQKIKSQADKTYDLLEQGVYTSEIFKERSEMLSKKRAEIESLISDEEREIEKLEKSISLHNDFIPYFESLLAVYQKTADIAEKNRLLKLLVERITYTKSVRNTRHNADEANFQLVVIPRIK